MLTESLLVVCIHLSSSVARFRIFKKRSYLYERLPSAVLPSFLFILFSLSPSLLPPPNSASSQHPLTTSPLLSPSHTSVSPLLISSPRVRDQSGEGLAEGVMRGWSWEPGRVRSALSPRGERGREITRSSPHASINTAPQLLSACTLSHEQHLSRRTRKYLREKHIKDVYTQTQTVFFLSPRPQKSQINAGTNRLCQSWQHRQ